MTSIMKFCTIALALTLSIAVAQLPPTPTPPLSEKMLETIRKNMEDYASDDPEIRRRAVLVLSKYKTNPAARGILMKALTDEEARIRQAAVVPLVEGFGDRPTALAVIRLLTDPSVSNRRICSAALPRLLLSLRVNRAFIAGRPPTRPSIPNEVIAQIRKAHADTDSTVRKNLVAIWSQVPNAVNFDVLTAYLKDADRDVRIGAMDKGRMIVPVRQYLKTVSGMVTDKDRVVRRRLAEILGNYSSFGDLKPLETLAKDADAEVRTRALMGLMKAGRVEAWSALKKDIDNHRLTFALAVSAIDLLPRLGETGLKELKGYLDSEKPAFRTAALVSLGRYQPQAISDAALLAALTDASGDVRKAATRVVVRRPQLAKSSLKALAASPHEDVRQLALSTVGSAPRKEAQSILMDLFLDESTTIRQGALRRIGMLRLDGWHELMSDALEDDEYAIREQAAISLLQAGRYPPRLDDPQLAPLKNYLKNGDDDKLKTFIRSRTRPFVTPLRP